jgi:hypothetical protein
MAVTVATYLLTYTCMLSSANPLYIDDEVGKAPLLILYHDNILAVGDAGKEVSRSYITFVDDREAEFEKVHHLHEELLLLRIGFFVSFGHDGCCCNPC